MNRFLTGCLLAMGLIAHAESYRAEAEDFTPQGKWQIGQHARYFSNAKCIVGMTKNGELTGSYNLAKAGKYQVWVRTETRGQKWRKGQLSINNKDLGSFGDEPLREGQKAGSWHWMRLKEIELEKGKIEFRITTPKGFVRIDAVILSDDASYVPPDNPADIMKVPALSPFAKEPVSTQTQTQGKGVKILLFNGGRPWQADSMTKLLSDCGFAVNTVSGQRLNGLSGASFENFITDKPTRKPIDGITPAFAELSPEVCKLVVFHMIPAENMSRVLRPENIVKLRSYVEKGGHVLFTYDMPAGLAEDLLPVTLDKPVFIKENYSANRPAGKNYDSFPEILPVLGTFRQAVSKAGAEVLSMIKDANGREIAPYLARIRIGEGTVTFFNAHKTNPKKFQDYANWAYSSSFFAQIAADCVGIKIKPKMTVFPPIPARTPLAEVTLNIADPVLNIADADEPAVLHGRQVRFGNGLKIDISPDGAVNVTFPGQDSPYIRNAQMPRMLFSPKQRVLNSQTAEAVDVEESSQTLRIDWKFTEARTRGNELILTYEDGNGKNRMIRRLKAGRMNLDGRIYHGIAEKTEVLNSPFLLSGIETPFELDLPDPLFARRFDCYQPPRGYKDFDLTGRENTVIKGGQPFKLIVCRNGVYLSHAMDIGSRGGTIYRKKGEPFIHTSLETRLGRVYAPVQTPWQWRCFSEGPERGHQEYLAMYQFYRRIVRQLYGLRELPACPVVRYDYQLTSEEKEAVIKAAVKAGYRYVSPPNPESPIEKINSPDSKSTYDWIAGMGAAIRIWTAGSYVQGSGGWIINHHPEWFVRDEKNNIFQYFRKYPVIDVNNPEFRKWCQGVYKDAIDHGVRWFYRDMDGAAAGTVNYGLKQSPWAGRAQAEIYKFLHDNGARVGVEGMNSLVLDEYWYRANLYTPLAGREFALVGQQPNGDILGGLGLDPVRTGMYGCFIMYEFSGTAFKFDRILGEAERGRRNAAFAPRFQQALDFVGMPFIRESEFGTVWYGKGGAVMFFWNPVKKLIVNLPDGWKIRGTDGCILTDIPRDSIIYIDRK